MSIKEQIAADLKEAMKAREQIRLDTLRSAISAIKYKETETGKAITAEEELAVLQKQVKQRNDAIAEYTKANRPELAEKESLERDILFKYLPAQKTPEEIKTIIAEIIASLPQEAQNQGAVMKAVMPKLKGLADGNLVKQITTELLSAK